MNGAQLCGPVGPKKWFSVKSTPIRTELLEAKHHSDALLDAPMVLLNQVKYFDGRCFVSSGNEPSVFSSRTAR
jgi:hypothetical protein